MVNIWLLIYGIYWNMIFGFGPENVGSTPIVPNGFADHEIPMKNGYNYL